jgi:hypothetical protein
MIPDELRTLLAAPAESVDLDFKEQVNWRSRRAKLELVRDIVCLANRNGGRLILGVADRGNNRFDAIGLVAGDDLPDSTVIGQLAAVHFDPPPIFRASEVEVDGNRFGVIDVDEFRRIPHICRTVGQDENGREVFREADILRRSDALECSRISTSDALSSLIESAAVKMGAYARSVVEQRAPAPNPPSLARPALEEYSHPAPESLLGTHATARACDLGPIEAQDRPVRDLPGLVEAATVHGRYDTVVPRGIDIRRMAPSEIVREPDRILITRSTGGDETTSLIEASTNLRVRLRERLWEVDDRVDFTSLVAYTLGCLAFAARFYEASAVETFEILVGLESPLGHVLATDPARFTPMFRTYIATSSEDIRVQRTLRTTDVTTADERAAIGREMVAELCWYFGYTVTDAAWEAHLRVTRTYVSEV